MVPVLCLSSEINGINDEKQSKIAFFQKFFWKKPMKLNFLKNFFGENVAWNRAQLLAKTWCPYLFWVLRNLPNKFEKLAHVTKSTKKNVTIWASRKARAPIA